jgi:hypothetical protein
MRNPAIVSYSPSGSSTPKPAAASEDRPEDHLDAMEAIFGNLSQETFRRFLRQANNVDDVLTLLEETDANATMR